MAKTETIKFNDFVDGSYKKKRVKKDFETITKIITASGAILVMVSPKVAFAATSGMDLYGDIMKLFDAGVVLVIVFAGAAWTLGHRTKAIEILIGACCGYIVARHAVDIRDFLKGI